MKFNALIPELSVSDIRASVDFYSNVLGFNLEYERPKDKFAFLAYGQAQIMLQGINNTWNVGVLDYPLGRGINFQIETSDLDGIVARLKENKVKPFNDIFESEYRQNDIVHKEKEILIQNPDGYLLRFSKSL